jgi:putative transposase
LTRCPCCNASHEFIYYNDGKKRRQLKCKVCHNLFQLHKRFQNPPKYFCPYCYKPLFTWKQRPSVTIYKCGNKHCSHRKQKLKALNEDEQKIRPERYSQFKVNYQYRDYHFELADLHVAKPAQPTGSLNRIHNDINIVGLILTLHISYAITARKTAHMLKNIWQIPVSYQTVLNYANAAAHYCHKFNQDNKGHIDDLCAGDETYVKVKAVWHYAWFFICCVSKKIAAYHFSNNRGAQPAIATMLETVRTAKPHQEITLVTDGNPSYRAGLHFINRYNAKLKVTLKKVIGLQNLDNESEEYRAYKQMVERLNKTYKYHIQAQEGFGNISGAVAKLVLFVTHYNFLRPHKALRYKTPIELSEFSGLSTIQSKWCRILSLASPTTGVAA